MIFFVSFSRIRMKSAVFPTDPHNYPCLIKSFRTSDGTSDSKKNHYDTQYNPVPAKYLEVMSADIIHQEFDDKNRYHKGNDTA